MADDTTNDSSDKPTVRDFFRNQAKRADAAARHTSDMSFSDRIKGNIFKELESAFLPSGLIGSALKAHLRSGNDSSMTKDFQTKSGIGYSKLNSEDVIKVMNANAQQTIKAINIVNSTLVQQFNRLSKENRERDSIFDGLARVNENQLLRLTEIRDFFDKEGYSKPKPGNGQYIGKDGKVKDDDFYDSSKDKSNSIVDEILKDAGIVGGLKAALNVVKSLAGRVAGAATGLVSGEGALSGIASGAAELSPLGIAAATTYGVGKVVNAGSDALMDYINPGSVERYNADMAKGPDWSKLFGSSVNDPTKKYLPGIKGKPPRLNPNYKPPGAITHAPTYSGPHDLGLSSMAIPSDSSEEKLKDEGYRVKKETVSTGDMVYSSRTLTYKADKIIFDSPFISVPGLGGSGTGNGTGINDPNSPANNNRDRLGVDNSGPNNSATPTGMSQGDISKNYNRDRQGVGEMGTGKGGTGNARQNAETYIGRKLSDSEYDELIRATHAEASGGKGDPHEEAMIMASILNRAKNKNKSVNDILHAGGQFQAVTGTKYNPNPSKNFTDGPNEKRMAGINSSSDLLSAVPHNQENFTAASDAAYGPGTNPKYRNDMLANGGKVFGGSVFNTNPDWSTAQLANKDGTTKGSNQYPQASINPATGEPTGHGLNGPDDVLGGENRVTQNQNGIRNKPIDKKVNDILNYAAQQTGTYADVFSGGQDAKGNGNRRTGSTRHDEGHAADTKFYKMIDGQRHYLDMRNPDDLEVMKKIVTLSRSAGATGIGAAEGYMGPNAFHIGLGQGKNGEGPDMTWGAGERSATTPKWLKDAYQLGKENPVDIYKKNEANAVTQNEINIGKELSRRSQDARINAIRRQVKEPPVVQNINNHSKNETSTHGNNHSNRKTVPAFDEMFMKLLANSPMNA